MKRLIHAKQLRKRITFFIRIGIVMLMGLSCNIYQLHDDRIELEKDSEWKYYSIDPETILKALDQGNTDVFVLLETAPDPKGFSSGITKVLWIQEDYFRIAQAVHKQFWGESLTGQNLFSTSFEINCSDVELEAFEEVSFNSFKTIQLVGEEETRIEHWITIIPAKNLVYTVEVEYQPNVHRKQPIDLEQYQITADEAVKIAEKNGGYEARLAVDNDCEITAFAPTVNGGGWEINYVNYPENFVKSLFTIAIDPQTGEYKVIFPK